MRDFNIIAGTFYNKEKETQYQNTLQDQQFNHGKDQLKKLPPSMVWRESVIMDPTKEITEAQRQIDEKQKQKKKRFELKYKLEKKYNQQELENDSKIFQKLVEKFDDNRLTQDYEKGFDIITLQQNKDYVDKIKQYITKQPKKSTWEKIQATSNLQNGEWQRPRRSTYHDSNAEQKQSSQQEKSKQIINPDLYKSQENPIQTNTNVYSRNMACTLPDESDIQFQSKRFSINDDWLRQRYHMPLIDRGTLPSLARKLCELPTKINQTSINDIKLQSPERTIQIVEYNMKPNWVRPVKRIKTGAFFDKN